MIPYVRKIVAENTIPRWFEVYNYFTFLPVIAYPLFLFITPFLFDRAEPTDLKMLAVYLVLLYPLYLCIIFRYNFPLYNRVRILAIVIPFLVTVSFYSWIAWFFS